MDVFRRLITGALSALGLAAQAQAADRQHPGPEVMRQLRERALTAPASDFGIRSTTELARTYGVLIDFPIDQQTATIVALGDGSASLYTASTFGIIGGGGHQSVKAAATRLITAADASFDQARPTRDYSYPAPGQVRFYLVSFSGVRVIDASLAAIESDRSTYYSNLFWLGQEVLTRLRAVTETRS